MQISELLSFTETNNSSHYHMHLLLLNLHITHMFGQYSKKCIAATQNFVVTHNCARREKYHHVYWYMRWYKGKLIIYVRTDVEATPSVDARHLWASLSEW